MLVTPAQRKLTKGRKGKSPEEPLQEFSLGHWGVKREREIRGHAWDQVGGQGNPDKVGSQRETQTQTEKARKEEGMRHKWVVKIRVGNKDK